MRFVTERHPDRAPTLLSRHQRERADDGDRSFAEVARVAGERDERGHELRLLHEQDEWPVLVVLVVRARPKTTDASSRPTSSTPTCPAVTFNDGSSFAPPGELGGVCVEQGGGEGQGGALSRAGR